MGVSEIQRSKPQPFVSGVRARPENHFTSNAVARLEQSIAFNGYDSGESSSSRERDVRKDHPKQRPSCYVVYFAEKVALENVE